MCRQLIYFEQKKPVIGRLLMGTVGLVSTSLSFRIKFPRKRPTRGLQNLSGFLFPAASIFTHLVLPYHPCFIDLSRVTLTRKTRKSIKLLKSNKYENKMCLEEGKVDKNLLGQGCPDQGLSSRSYSARFYFVGKTIL